MTLRQDLQDPLGRWLQARTPATDVWMLTQRNVYILPTGPGLLLATTLLVLLLASINFQLSLGYALVFLLSGCALVAMHMGHATLRGLRLQLQPVQARFFGTDAALDIVLHNTRSEVRYGVGLTLSGTQQWAWADVPGHASRPVQLAWRASQRGRSAVPTLRAQTRFPMGIFRVWTVWRPASSVLVYPHPETNAPPIPGTPAQDAAGDSPRSAEPAWEGLRPYRRGDALRSIAWKKSGKAIAAGSDAWVSREAPSQNGADVWLDLAHTGLRDPEAQLSRLCAWVIHAHTRSLRYGLLLAGQRIAPSQGPAHLQRCLEALALC
ncbi:MAG: DUF58 domain-containing protein [Betaproteobacteria bacterium]